MAWAAAWAWECRFIKIFDKIPDSKSPVFLLRLKILRYCHSENNSCYFVIDSLTIAFLERTKEIGIMKSLGASNRDIWKLFLVESVLIGILASRIFNFFINKLAGFLGGQEVSLFYTPFEFIVIIMILSTVVGALTGLYPSRRAAKLNPLDALRYK